MEPERKIEKLLRAYAKKRRADAGEPLKLHPAMRRLLQDEVARQPNPREEKYVSLWELFRQQWAIIAGFALVIFFCASLFLPALSPAKRKAQNITAVSPNPIPSASNSSQAEQRAVAMAPPAPVPAGIPEVAPPAAPANASAGIQESTLAGNLQPSSAPPAAAPAMADRLLATQAFYYRNIAPNSDQTYSRNIARGQTFGARSPAIAQNAGSSAQIMSVLANFQLQQNGNAIRVVDSDGSIYAGSLFPMQTAAQNTPATINGAAGSVQKDSSRTAGIGPQTTGYFANNTIAMPPQARTNGVETLSFRVAGMNRTLRQNVVFDGSFLALSNASNSSSAGTGGFGGGGFGGVGQLQPPINQQQQLQLSSLRVTGNATIGQTNEINIYATPVAQQQQN